MSRPTDPALLLLHALPLDGSIWDIYADLLPAASYAPTLYGFGNTLEGWARAVLERVPGNRLIVVGCSVGGSCALELAAIAPDRVAVLVLVGTKARNDPDPAPCASVLETVEGQGMDRAWARYWAPSISKSADAEIVKAAQRTALGQRPEEIARGVAAFHSRRSRHWLVAECESPIIVVTGEDDVAPGQKASAELAARARRGSLQVIPSCGHYAPLEKPGVLKAIPSDVIRSQGRAAG